MNRRVNRTPWHPDSRPSPLFVLSLFVFIALFLVSTCVGAAEMARAPVVKPDGDVLMQTGWYTYKREPGTVVLYCVPTSKRRLTCAVYVVADSGVAGVMLVHDVEATEISS